MTVALDDFLVFRNLCRHILLGGQEEFVISFLSLVEDRGLCLSLGFKGVDHVLVLPADLGGKATNLAKLAPGVESDTPER